MIHNLTEYRYAYAHWRNNLSIANKNKAPKEVKAQIMRNLNRTRNRLQNEINRLSWLLWPETGRPYMGPWQVIGMSDRPIFTGTLKECMDHINRSRYGGYYKLIKQSD